MRNPFELLRPIGFLMGLVALLSVPMLVAGEANAQQASPGALGSAGKKWPAPRPITIIGIITQKMYNCLVLPSDQKTKGIPIISMQLRRDGSISEGPTLTNPRDEPVFMAFAEANIRALRDCAPYPIPPVLLESYDKWKNLSIGIVPSDS